MEACSWYILSENCKAGFRGGDAEAFLRQPGQNGFYGVLKDSVGPSSVICLNVNTEVIGKKNWLNGKSDVGQVIYGDRRLRIPLDCL